MFYSGGTKITQKLGGMRINQSRTSLDFADEAFIYEQVCG